MEGLAVIDHTFLKNLVEQTGRKPDTLGSLEPSSLVLFDQPIHTNAERSRRLSKLREHLVCKHSLCLVDIRILGSHFPIATPHPAPRIPHGTLGWSCQDPAHQP